MCERGAGSRRVDSGFLGEPAFVRACGLAVRIYGPLFVARQSSSKLQVSSPPTRAPAAPQADKPNQPDKGWPSGRGADGGHGGAVQLGHSLVPSRSGIDSDPYPASKRIRTCLAAPQRGCPGGRSTSDGALGCLCGAAASLRPPELTNWTEAWGARSSGEAHRWQLGSGSSLDMAGLAGGPGGGADPRHPRPPHPPSTPSHPPIHRPMVTAALLGEPPKLG